MNGIENNSEEGIKGEENELQNEWNKEGIRREDN
jgi:hypothetical protein